MVSVIIPIYNVKKFIPRGIKQVLQQTYQDIEIILVDDGSTDGSYEDCIEIAKSDPRITVFHQNNQGAGSARNLGLANAKGEYIYFFDIDDEIDAVLIEYNVEVMNTQNVDMVVFGYKNIEPKFDSVSDVVFPETIVEGNSKLKDIFVNEFVLKVNGFVWNKFYRKSFIDKYHLKFPDLKIQQDEVFNLYCYRYLDKLFLSSRVLYNYYIYDKGNTRSHYIPDRFNIYKSVHQRFQDLINHWDINDKILEETLKVRFLRGIFCCLSYNIFSSDCILSHKERKLEFQKIAEGKETKTLMKQVKMTQFRAFDRLCYCALKLKPSLIAYLFVCTAYKFHSIFR